MMLETVAEGRINFSHRIDIADECGAVVGSVTFARRSRWRARGPARSDPSGRDHARNVS